MPRQKPRPAGEHTGYDAVIKYDPSSTLAKEDGGTLYATLLDGTVVVDRHQMVVQIQKEA